jgi:heme/copper-type cytochrome/quinol oxidase subunit 2
MEPGRTSYRAVRAIGVLLILEVIGLVVLGGYEFLQVDWRGIDLGSQRHRAVEVAVFALFIPSAILTLLAALSFLFMHRRGWLLAAIAQGLSLAVSLWLYSLFQPGYVYPIMAYCVLMILYLNARDVRVVFQPRQSHGASHEH